MPVTATSTNTKIRTGNYTAVLLTFTSTGNVYRKKLIPNYAKIMIPNSSPAAKHTLQTQIMRITDELRFLHMKKQQINLQLYRLHLSLANT